MAGIEVLTLSGEHAVIADAIVDDLRSSLRGPVILPGDPSYDSARKVWNGMIDKRPALIVRCLGAADIIATVQFAQANDVLLTVRAGGHNVAGKSMSEGGLTVDLSLMKGIRVNPGQRTAEAQPGLLLGDFDRETQAFGLATTMGALSDTGIAGLTLGGGYGWLVGKFGLTCDNLVAVDVVTANGQLLRVNATENEELFWAIRGAGHNFGIVTSFEYALHEVGPVLGGMVLHKFSKGKDVLRFYDEYANTCPDELTTNLGIVTTPDGQLVIAILTCYCGSLALGEQVLKPLRAFGPPLADLVRPMPYVQVQQMLDAALPAGQRVYWRSSFIRRLSEDAIETILAHAEQKPTPMTSVVLQQLHGAGSRVDPTATAFPHRFDHHEFFPTAVWVDPADDEGCINWSRSFWDAMQPFLERSVYVNELGDEGEDRVRAAYGPNYDRLVALKKKYDPTNFFRANQNIDPTA